MEGDICGKTFLLLKTCQDKKLHIDLTKPCEMCKVYDVKEWPRDIQLCPKKPTATAAGKPTFDCVPSNKSFPKIHFLFVLSICLPPRLLSGRRGAVVKGVEHFSTIV